MDRGIEKTYLNWDPEIDRYVYDDLIYDNGISTQLAQIILPIMLVQLARYLEGEKYTGILHYCIRKTNSNYTEDLNGEICNNIQETPCSSWVTSTQG